MSDKYHQFKLLLNIDRLVDELGIKVSGDIKYLDKYKILQFEVKALKESIINSPSYFEITAILFSVSAFFISIFTILLNVESETVFHLTKTEDIKEAIENIAETKYLIKEGYSTSDRVSTYSVYFFGVIIIFISLYFVSRQYKLSNKIKKIILLEQCLDEYIKLSESKEAY